MNRQLSLFDGENRQVAHIAGLTAVIRAAMNRSAAASPYSRQQIVDRMNHLAQASGVRMTQGNARGISLDTLEKWLNPDGGFVPSLVAVAVFMQAVNTMEPLTAWLGLFGCEVMTERDRLHRDISRAAQAREEAARMERRLKTRLQEEGL